MRLRLTVAATLTTLTIVGSAAAQQAWLQDRRYGQGVGLRAGDVEFHPSLAAEMGYDSNYFQRSNVGIEAPLYDAWRLRITPSLSLSSLKQRIRDSEAVGTTPSITYNLGGYLTYNELFGSEQVADERHLDAGVGGRIDLLNNRPVGIDLYGDYMRSGEPSNDPNLALAPAFDRGSARGGLGATWRPGGGLFEWRLGYEAAYNYFEDAPYDRLQNLNHTINTRGRWRFLPRTALVYSAGYTFVRYLKDDSPQPNGDYVEARVGLNGLITNRFAVTANLGWTSTFYEGQAQTTVQNYDGYVMNAQLKYFLIPTATAETAQAGISSIALGYQRDFSNSYLGTFYIRDYGYLKLETFFAGQFVASVQGGIGRYSYPESDPLNGSFEQTRFDIQAFGEYRFSDTFGINTSISYDRTKGKGPNPEGVLVQAGNADDPNTPADEATPDLYDNLEYSRFQAYLGLRAFW